MNMSGSEALQQPDFTSIDTERLHLRTLQMADAEALYPMLADPNVMKWTSSGYPVQDLAQAESWLRPRALGPGVFNFTVQLRMEGVSLATQRTVIGIVGSIHPPEIGYIIHPGINN